MQHGRSLTGSRDAIRKWRKIPEKEYPGLQSLDFELKLANRKQCRHLPACQTRFSISCPMITRQMISRLQKGFRAAKTWYEVISSVTYVMPSREIPQQSAAHWKEPRRDICWAASPICRPALSSLPVLSQPALHSCTRPGSSESSAGPVDCVYLEVIGNECSLDPTLGDPPDGTTVPLVERN